MGHNYMYYLTRVLIIIYVETSVLKTKKRVKRTVF